MILLINMRLVKYNTDSINPFSGSGCFETAIPTAMLFNLLVVKPQKIPHPSYLVSHISCVITGLNSLNHYRVRGK